MKSKGSQILDVFNNSYLSTFVEGVKAFLISLKAPFLKFGKTRQWYTLPLVVKTYTTNWMYEIISEPRTRAIFFLVSTFKQ